MSLCKFYNTKYGCNKGDSCTFRHVSESSDNEAPVDKGVSVSDKGVSDKERLGLQIYNTVYGMLKACCPFERIHRIQAKVTGMLLEMTPEEICVFLGSASCQQERLNEAFAAMEEDGGEFSEMVKEIKLYKKFLIEIVAFFAEKRLEEVNVHLSYTKETVKVGLIQMQKPEKKNNYVFVVPGDSKEEREYCMNLAANDRFFQTNIRKGLSEHCHNGYFTMKYIDVLEAVSIQAIQRY
jgi:hypothetical protein